MDRNRARARRRMCMAERRQHVIEAAVRIAERYGLPYVTHVRVAEECYWPTSVSTVWRMIGDTQRLQDVVAKKVRLTKR